MCTMVFCWFAIFVFKVASIWHCCLYIWSQFMTRGLLGSPSVFDWKLNVLKSVCILLYYFLATAMMLMLESNKQTLLLQLLLLLLLFLSSSNHRHSVWAILMVLWMWETRGFVTSLYKTFHCLPYHVFCLWCNFTYVNCYSVCFCNACVMYAWTIPKMFLRFLTIVGCMSLQNAVYAILTTAKMEEGMKETPQRSYRQNLAVLTNS
jgi:hypothetical protein